MVRRKVLGHRIIEVQSKREEKIFLELPWKIYRKNTNWVPPLRMNLKDLLSKDHPFYQNATVKKWLALDEKGQAVGRVAAIINHAHNQFHQEKCGHFGLFECLHQPEVAEALLAQAEDYLCQQGMEVVRGPMSPSTNYECGVLVKGFEDPPQLMMSYNPPYYCSLLERSGYVKGMDLLAYQIPAAVNMPEVVNRYTEKIQKTNHITWRTISKKTWDADIDEILEIYNSAWENNWGFVPMSSEEFHHMARGMKTIAKEELILIVKINNVPAGFIVALPDYNQIFKNIKSGKLFPTGIVKLLTGEKKINRARVITLGIKKEFRNTGIALFLYKQIQKQILDSAQYNEVEMSWILETNRAMNRPLQLMGARAYKTYRIYQKKLEGVEGEVTYPQSKREAQEKFQQANSL
jgi:hypothetical protein